MRSVWAVVRAAIRGHTTGRTPRAVVRLGVLAHQCEAGKEDHQARYREMTPYEVDAEDEQLALLVTLAADGRETDAAALIATLDRDECRMLLGVAIAELAAAQIAADMEGE